MVGSPPLARGKVIVRVVPTPNGRITPACAGKRKGSLVFLREVEDHPRLRGEKSSIFVNIAFIIGSPPLARGKVQND